MKHIFLVRGERHGVRHVNEPVNKGVRLFAGSFVVTRNLL